MSSNPQLPEGVLPELPADSPHTVASLEHLDRTFLQLRRFLIKPEVASIPIPSIGRSVDLAKVMACIAIAEGPEITGHGHPPTVKDVAAVLLLDHSTASRLLSEAEAEGLIRRSTDPSDRRRTVVELTDVGTAVWRESSQIRTWAIGILLRDWTADEVSTLTAQLDRLLNTFATRLPELLAERGVEYPLPPALG